MLQAILFWGGMSALVTASYFLSKVRADQDHYRFRKDRIAAIQAKHQMIREARAAREPQEKSLTSCC